jgi:allantoicase
VEGRLYTHIKVTIHPDGGIKRVRIIGTKGRGSTFVPQTKEPGEAVEVMASTTLSGDLISVPVLPLTPEAFAPFGQVIQAYGDHNAAPKGTKITPANQGSASKFHKLSLLASSYPADTGATAGISVYRCNPLEGISGDGTADLKIMERHPFTNQAFIPMGKGTGEGLSDPGSAYLVVVAKNAANGRPDVTTVRAFVANASQGIVYDTAIWRESGDLHHCASQPKLFRADQPMTVLGKVGHINCEFLKLFIDDFRPWTLRVSRRRWETEGWRIVRSSSWRVL